MNKPTSADARENNGQFESFDLTVHLGPDAIPWISATSRVGAVHGIPRHMPSLPGLEDLLDRVYDYKDDIQFAELQPDPELARVLRELVFGDPAVLQLFQATRGVAADRGRQLLFRILTSPHLATLPWELLPDPVVASDDRRQYLTLAPDTHLVRQARGRTYPTHMSMLEAPLNLLLVLSSPIPENEREDWLSFDIFEVKRNLLAELAPLQEAGLLRIDVEDRPTLDNLRRRIGAQRRGYHLFHYVGHAYPEALILEDRAGYRENLSGAKLVELLRLCPDLRLAVFAGCETARAAADPSAVDTRAVVGWRDLLSLADYCVQEACPAVIGMQAVLPFSTERIFTRFFYQALATGYTTSESLRLARGAIQADLRVGGELLDWSVPVLFVGSDEPGAIVPRVSTELKAKAQVRSELILGLQQRNERFFGRDLPLRQAVDVMTGLTLERVLVVTGADGNGKTALMDRALEEVGNSVSHVLFVTFDRLAPEVAQAWDMLARGQLPDTEKLSRLRQDHALERLCRLTHELLRHSGLQARDHSTEWSMSEWWERLVQDMARQKFVLVIDDLGKLDRLQRGLLKKLLADALAAYVEERRKEVAGAQPLQQELWAQLSGLQEVFARPDTLTLTALWERIAISEKVLKELEKLPDRLRLESAQVYSERLEQQIFNLDQKAGSGAVANTGQLHSPKASNSKNLLLTLLQLEEVRRSLGDALRALADKRSQVRIVVSASAPPRDFFNLPDDMVFEMRLAPLTWAETWRWIRRSLPGLVRFGEETLSRLWGRLGTRLLLWEELERQVLKQRGQVVNLSNLVTNIAPLPPRRAEGSLEQTARRGHRALRIAVAGPHLAEPNEVAEAITRLATEQGVGGRVVFDADERGALAVLIDEESPFLKQDLDSASEIYSKILKWLNRIIAHQPDIILLDYGEPSAIETLGKQVSIQQTLFRNIQYSTLLIAAGGNELRIAGGGREKPLTMVTIPSAYPEVLSVGPLDDDGRLREYAEWRPRLAKPDLFMTDNLDVTSLATAIKPDMQSARGASFSAFHAVATAALVWSLLPELPPRAIRDLLVKAGQPIPGTKGALGLTMESAIGLARRRLVEQTLQEGAASLQTLSAITGLEGWNLSAVLELMIKEGRVIRLATGRLERFQLLHQCN